MKTDDAAHVDGAAGPVAGDARPGTAGAERSGATHDGDTRAAVVELLLQEGPVTAGEIGARLGLSAAGVRRHLDALLDAGEAREVTSRTRRRGRGRPAKHFQITAQGRRRLGHAYDDLAGAALRQLREVGGDAAIEEFARRRVQSIVSSVPRAGADASDVADKAEAVATAFNDAGFAASTRPVGHGVQICQHHCPVSHVAEEFPELCEAERAALTEILGTHVQQLATIANGDVACTTHVPLAVHPPPPR